MSAANSGPIIWKFWTEWVKARGNENRTVADKLLQEFFTDRKVKIRSDTVMGWLGKKKERDVYRVRLVTGDTNRKSAIDLFCSYLDNPGMIDPKKQEELLRAWKKDDDEEFRSKIKRTALWLPDGSLKKKDDRNRLAQLHIEPSLESDAPDQPSLIVSLDIGSFPGAMEFDGVRIEYDMAIGDELEIDRDFDGCGMVPRTVLNSDTVRDGTRWIIKIDRASRKNRVLDGERLAVLRLDRTPCQIKLILYCQRNQLRPTITNRPTDNIMILRVLERILQIWGVDPGAMEVALSEARLLPPGDGQ